MIYPGKDSSYPGKYHQKLKVTSENFRNTSLRSAPNLKFDGIASFSTFVTLDTLR